MSLIVFVIILDNSDELTKGNYGKTQKKTEFNLNNNGYSFYDAMLLVRVLIKFHVLIVINFMSYHKQESV